MRNGSSLQIAPPSGPRRVRGTAHDGDGQPRTPRLSRPAGRGRPAGGRALARAVGAGGGGATVAAARRGAARGGRPAGRARPAPPARRDAQLLHAAAGRGAAPGGAAPAGLPPQVAPANRPGAVPHALPTGRVRQRRPVRRDAVGRAPRRFLHGRRRRPRHAGRPAHHVRQARAGDQRDRPPERPGPRRCDPRLPPARPRRGLAAAQRRPARTEPLARQLRHGRLRDH